MHGDRFGSSTTGAEAITAGNGVLNGHGGNDRIIGGEANDILTGGRGGDYLAGNEGADIFQYAAVEESQNIVVNGANQLDQIVDSGFVWATAGSQNDYTTPQRLDRRRC